MSRQLTGARLPRPSELATMTDRQFFRCLADNGPMTRAAIAQATGISKPTISESAQRLLKQALIVESDQRTKGHQGRAGVIYEINGERGSSLGIMLESGHIQARALDLNARTIWETSEPLSPSSQGRALVDRIEKIVRSCQQQCSGQELLAIGLSIADPVDPSTGEVISLPQSPFPAAHGLSITHDFGSTWDYPITIDNDVNWATLAESRFGCMKDEKNFLYVYLGKGIGAGMFMSGQLQRGANGLAGEIGYVKTSSGATLLDLLSLQVTKDKNEYDVIHLDAPTVDAIGQAIITATTLLNPSAIVLGGPLCESDRIFRQLEESISSGVLLPLPIKRSALTRNGPLDGASAGAHELALAVLGTMDPATDITQIGFSTAATVCAPD